MSARGRRGRHASSRYPRLRRNEKYVSLMRSRNGTLLIGSLWVMGGVQDHLIRCYIGDCCPDMEPWIKLMPLGC